MATNIEVVLQTGAPGAAGVSPTVAVGTTTTGAAGTAAKVTNSGTANAAVFDFVIPQGIGNLVPDWAVSTAYVLNQTPGYYTDAQPPIRRERRLRHPISKKSQPRMGMG